ncbi:LacI family DNA-binding transcriptional regulator [Paraburkholderia xenovorans]|uniref:LacI family DNA-binding transcriptional regulator n=1 Tax=Paraburkholderia xenovorans TaxID=36873 RepID=UPI0038BB57CA
MKRNGQIKTPTSVDVARLAGVSQSIVSLVFSGKDGGRITPERRQAVLDAAEQIGYRPNSAARGLKLGTQRLLALVVPDVSNPYFAAVLKFAAAAARKQGYATVLINADQDQIEDAEHLIMSLSTHSFDGLIAWDAPWVSRVKEVLPASVVIVDGDVSDGADVFISSTRIIRMAVDHMAALGHRRIARLGISLRIPTFRARAQAFRDSLHAHGLEFNENFEVEVPFGATSSERLTELLQMQEYPTAVVCDDDLLAPLVYRAAIRAGRRIPEDVSVIGVDDIALASLLEPPLTTIVIPAQTLAEVSVEVALKKLRGQSETVRVMDIELVVRGSTASIK